MYWPHALPGVGKPFRYGTHSLCVIVVMVNSTYHKYLKMSFNVLLQRCSFAIGGLPHPRGGAP